MATQTARKPPVRVQRILDQAAKLGLEVARQDDSDDELFEQSSWVVYNHYRGTLAESHVHIIWTRMRGRRSMGRVSLAASWDWKGAKARRTPLRHASAALTTLSI